MTFYPACDDARLREEEMEAEIDHLDELGSDD
jgi:hypothetical protein